MSLRYAVLGLLAQEPGSGYDLLRRFNSTLAYVWPATQSQLYLELGRLADDHLIEVSGTGARNRKDYAITTIGRDQLAHWLDHPAHEVTRNTALLQLFLMSEGSPTQVKQFLNELRERVQAKREQLEEIESTTHWDDTSRDVFARRVLAYGIRQAHTELVWLTEVEHDLDR